MIDQVWLIPFLPLLGGLIAALGGRRLGERSHLPVALGIGLAFLVAVTLLPQVGPKVAGPHEAHAEAAAGAEAGEHHEAPDHSRVVTVYHWLQLGQSAERIIDGQPRTVYQLDIPIQFRVDGLTVMMLCMVTFVATLVTVFASGYMHGDPAYPRFFALVGLFVFCMTGLVLSNNFVLTYAFWEGVGVCSYLLIGFWHSKPSAAAAAQKAFLVNRIGDVGFALAIFWMWVVSPNHDLSYDVVLSPLGLGQGFTAGTKMGVALLLFWAATAKSAQVPLYVWLPDAMEGPTPVSALIHAATMVTAGVYLVARSAALVFSDPFVPLVICVIGAITALLAALMALTQNDLKRVLAYSTISQLGYMFMALGTGVGDVAFFAVTAAMFHLFTHAFFKALLFLGSGSVMHSMGHVIDMRRFGGLRHRMPITCWTFAIGSLALAGIFPLAGFFSKDEVLASIRQASGAAEEAIGPGYGSIYSVIYGVALLTAFLTAFYTGRAFFLTFFGPEKLPSPSDPEAEPGEHDHSHDAHFGHESPAAMTTPLMILAGATVLVGLLFGPITGLFEGLLESTPTWSTLQAAEPHGTDWQSVILGTLAGVLGLGLSYVWYGKPVGAGGQTSAVPAKLAKASGPLYGLSLNKFYVDEAYGATVGRPTTVLAHVCKFFDVYVVDNLVKLVAWVPRFVGRDLLAPFQNGLVQFYAGATALGVAALLLVLLLT